MFGPHLNEAFRSRPTPFYYYDLDVLRDTLTRLSRAAKRHGYQVHYAVKANAEPRILQIIREYGLGADCVSGNEVARALEVGFPREKVVFAGVGKTDAEIRLALERDIAVFNCESLQELTVINEIAGALGKRARVAFRLNPDVDARTHAYIRTGRAHDKFGIHAPEWPEVLALLPKLRHVEPVGLHFHIGSQITDLEVFRELALQVNRIQESVGATGWQPRHLNLGGGLGIDYRNPDALPDFEAYFDVFQTYLRPLPEQTIHFELGRAVVAPCGTLVSRVTYVKRATQVTFAVLDASMTDLLRPALYGAEHKIENLSRNGPVQAYDVVGPVCESADRFGRNVRLPETHRGDLVAIRSTGAYGQVMASRYNLRDLAPAVFSDELAEASQ